MKGQTISKGVKPEKTPEVLYVQNSGENSENLR
jgi:hypothetical protein